MEFEPRNLELVAQPLRRLSHSGFCQKSYKA